jgi:hypothetical protein
MIGMATTYQPELIITPMMMENQPEPELSLWYVNLYELRK